ncbi:MAG: hypothetical protein HOY71_50660 [Nonomuraea sp.]|nr:hypothetical protein [Nonomuraea sp.]
MNEQLGRLATIRDEHLAGLAASAGADALLDRILAEPVPSKRGRIAFGLATVAVVAAAAIVGPAVLPGLTGPATSYANSAIAIEQRGDQWVARVKDPYADHALYREAFQAVGLDVGLQIVPVSPRSVGHAVRMTTTGNVTEGKGIGGQLEPEGCTLGSAGCAFEVSVAVGFTGRGTVMLGRPARDGERYQDHADPSLKGGPLAGVRVDDRRVGDVLADVRARGLRAVFSVIEPSPGYDGYGVDPKAAAQDVADGWWVWDAEQREKGVVTLLVTREHLPKNPVYGGPKPVSR